MQEVYPKHLYEPIRRELAANYVKHELRKFLPSVKSGETWESIDSDIDSWFSEAPFLYPVRDFWNGVHGIMMGFKLYTQLLSFITGENVKWERKFIDIRTLSLASVSELFKEVGVDTNDVGKIIDLYDKEENKQLRKEHLEKIMKFYNNTFERRNDPIIVTQKRVNGEDGMIVYEGNGRTSLAILEGKDKIEAYVGMFTGEAREPINYWLPTSLLMEVLHFARRAWEVKEEDLYHNYVLILKDMLSRSESGKYEMRERAITGPEGWKSQILKDLELN